MKSTKIESRAQWLELRRKTVGASEIGSVVGVSKRRSRLATWLIKAGQMEEPDLSENEFVLWGQRLEPVIAEAAAEEHGWKIRKVRRYLESDRVPGMGASLDFEIVSHADGPGVLEIKNVDAWQFKNAWEDGEPPLDIQLQLQHQLGVIERSWGVVVAFVGGNRLMPPWQYGRHDASIARIEREVAAFWESIRENKPPEPDWMADAELVAAMHREVTKKKVVKIQANEELTDILLDMNDAANKRYVADRDIKVLRAKLLAILDDAEAAFIEDVGGRLWHVSAPLVDEAEVPAYTRKAYRRVTVKQKNEPKSYPRDIAIAKVAARSLLQHMDEEEKVGGTTRTEET